MVYSPTVPATARRPSSHPGAVGAVHPGRLHGRRLLDREHGARERRRRHPDRVRRRVARGRRDRREPDAFKDVQVAEYVGEAIHCAQGDDVCMRRRQVRPATRRRRGPTAARRAGRLQRLPGAVRRAVHRPADRRRARTSRTTATRSPTRTGISSTSTGTRSRSRSASNAGLPRVQPDGDAVPGRTGRHAGGRHPRHLRLHLRPARAEGGTSTAARPRPRRPPASRSAPATPATSTNAQHYDAGFADVLPAARQATASPRRTRCS